MKLINLNRKGVGIALRGVSRFGVSEETPPEILFDGNTSAWYDYQKEITLDENEKVSVWGDISNNEKHLTQATPDKRPGLVYDGVYFDSINDFLTSEAFTLNQPVTVYIVANQWYWGSYRHLFSGLTNWTGVVMQRTVASNLQLRSTTATAENTTNKEKSLQIIRAQFNGANSTLQINEESKTTGNAGTAALGGITLGALGDGSVYFAGMSAREYIVRKVVDDETTQKEIYDYLYNKYFIDSRDVGLRTYRVDEPLVGTYRGITRIHDLIADDARGLIWGCTRSEDYDNYVFSLSKKGDTITKSSLVKDGSNNKPMFIDWGGSSLWMANIGTNVTKVFLIKTNPDTLECSFYSHASRQITAACLTYNNGFVYVGDINIIDSVNTIVLKFNVNTEMYEEIPVNGITQLYWAVFDGTYHWFSGVDGVTGNAKLLRIASDDTYAVFDLGEVLGVGAEISYGDGYIWRGSNATNKMIRFNTITEAVDVITLPQSNFFPRLNMQDDDFVWVWSNNSFYGQINKTTLEFKQLSPTFLIPYSHGLTSDKNHIWVSTWADECNIFRIPKGYY